MRKIILSLCVVLLLAGGAAADNPVWELYQQLGQKFPTLESVREQLGPEAVWREELSRHWAYDNIEIKSIVAANPGIEIMGAELTGGRAEVDGFRLASVAVIDEGIVDFGGIDIRSARADVIRVFGEPCSIENNTLRYQPGDAWLLLTFTIHSEGWVSEMKIEVFGELY